MKKFIRELFSDSDGLGSFSRSASGAVVFTCLFLLTFITIKHSAFPDQATLLGVAGFCSSVVLALYGVNNAGDIISSLRGAVTKVKDTADAHPEKK